MFLLACKKETTDKPWEIISGSMIDVDGNVYKTVKIGNLWWMSENLRVEHFNDGTPIDYIPVAAADTIWSNNNLPAFTFLNDTLYGKLYNAHVLTAGSIAPAGWRVATDSDWKNLEESIGVSATQLNLFGWRGDVVAKLLPYASAGWPLLTIPFGSDTYGFNVRPSGCKLFNGPINATYSSAFFWTNNITDSLCMYRYIDYKKNGIFRQRTYKNYGMSIRLVKDV